MDDFKKKMKEKVNKNNWKFIFLLAILIFVVIFSLSNLTTRPKVWFDEGLNIEIARNFLLFHKLDISTAPNVFSGVPYAVGTNGYPLTIPLAGVFHIFGFGLAQTRVFMLCWMLAALLSVYFIVGRFFGVKKALVTTAFIATFAPFYGNGLTAFGEVPGFIFLIWGLFFLLKPERQNYWLTGLFFSLAATTKPSLYLLLFPSFLIFLFLEEKKEFFKKISKFILGAIPPIFLWFALAFSDPFSLKIWREALLFYKYPFGREFSILSSLFSNIKLVFTHSTLIYFLLVTFAAVLWFFINGKKDFIQRKWGVFFFIYGIFAFLYFLKSPGWLRYLFGFELLAFVFLPPALKMIAEKIFKEEKLSKLAFYGASVFFIAIQLVQLFFFRSDFYSDAPEKTISFINENLMRNGDYKVGFLNAPEIAGFIDSAKKFHIVKVGGPLPVLGENPLSFPKKSLPQFISFEGENDFSRQYKNVLDENYFLLKKIGHFNVYELK